MRFHAIGYLNIPYTVKTAWSDKLHFSQLTKSWKNGKTLEWLKIRVYPQIKDIYEMTCLKERPKDVPFYGVI